MRLWDPATGALQQKLSLSEVVEYLEFTDDNLCLKTDLGHLVLQDCGDDRISMSPQKNHDIWIRGHKDQYSQRKWTELKGEKTFWLPRDCRPTCFAIYANTLALGHASGRISFLAFDV